MKITSKIYLRIHRDDSEMVELMRTTIRRWTTTEGEKRVRTEDSIFAVLHIDLFEGDILASLNDEEADVEDYTEVEFKLVGSPPKRQRDGEDDGYGDWLYDQRKDEAAERAYEVSARHANQSDKEGLS